MYVFFFFKQKTAYEMRISDWSSDVCSSDLDGSTGRLKFNPLANWTREMLDAYFEAHDLPRHPLEAEGYPSIGCSPCTSQVKPGDDPRAGRWRGWAKTDCGIHEDVTTPGADPANAQAFSARPEFKRETRPVTRPVGR